MNVLEELFPDFRTFSLHVTGIDSNVTFESLNSSAITAKKRVSNLISEDIYKKIVKESEDTEAKTFLRAAIANYTAKQQLYFDTVKNRKNGIDLYKYEAESMIRAYMDNYFNAMDSLICLLAKKYTEEFSCTRFGKLVGSLKIRTTEEFDLLYPIDLSYLFFFRCVPLQKEVLDDTLGGYYSRSDDNTILALLNRILAKMVVAKALIRFDILEFPPTIRNLFSDNTSSRSGSDEQERMISLSQELMNEASNSLRNVDLLLSSEETSDICTQTSFNTQEDKIYLLP